ncbi:enoyl-CoA hydratase/isomerase [Melanomma pulvis-pyrius CBS 109.77]|uniref:Enoyl-CoA hydratase/isomerase n=1 Tax=Melanomma pulvis-pyrius CBS 109.77 TaxID=1314802 RepID=A0A6A6XMQ6_9PLEO|nr:enoyl-CoA hydratase/isomerase [Melanomma pulvis-pyrius CBS 109.77]
MDALAENPSNVLLSIRETGVAVVQLNRPLKRNALSQHVIDNLTTTLRQLSRETAVRVVVLTSAGQSPFCAGADLSELGQISTVEAFERGWLKDLEDAFAGFRKPVIAAVRGFAFGGGFEIALMCDMIYTSADAKFGFPEIKLSTIPGAGGTQRLTKALGKHKAMELILTGSPTTAAEMERFGIVNRVCSAEEDVVDVSLKVAETVATFSAPAIGMAKQAVKAAEATTLTTGLEIERSLYYSTFSLQDCQEGIAAFLQKRSPSFQDR